MKTEITQLIAQMEGLYSGRNWVGVGTVDTLRSILPQTAVQQKLARRHSILEILQHANAWRTFLLKRLQGDEQFNIGQDDDIDWQKNNGPADVLWPEAVREYHELHQAILHELQAYDDSLLDQIVAKRSYTFRFLINGIIQHDFYHLGQMVLLR